MLPCLIFSCCALFELSIMLNSVVDQDIKLIFGIASGFATF